MSNDKLDRIAREVEKLSPAGKLVIHVRNKKTGKERVETREYGGPRDVNIDLDEQDMKLL